MGILIQKKEFQDLKRGGSNIQRGSSMAQKLTNLEKLSNLTSKGLEGRDFPQAPQDALLTTEYGLLTTIASDLKLVAN